MNKYQSCPFCGGTGVPMIDGLEGVSSDNKISRYFIMCLECRARTKTTTGTETAWSFWNMRANKNE